MQPQMHRSNIYSKSPLTSELKLPFPQVGVLSKFLLSSGNWTAYFLPLAGFGAVALLVTFFFPSSLSF